MLCNKRANESSPIESSTHLRYSKSPLDKSSKKSSLNDSKTFQINCPNFTSFATSTSSNLNDLKYVYKNKTANTIEKNNSKKIIKSKTQFFIKFHPFSFKLPNSNIFLVNSNNKQSTKQQAKSKTSESLQTDNPKMNQRCCLSVSVVPSEKQNSNKKKSKNKNNVRHFYFL